MNASYSIQKKITLKLLFNSRNNRNKIIYLCSVKNRYKTTILFILIAIYSIAIGAVNTQVAFQAFNYKNTVLQERSIADFSEKYYCPTIQLDNVQSASPNLPTSNEKNPTNDLTEISYCYDQIEEAGIVQYISIARTILFHHRKSDLIFPFHYFW